MVKLWLCLSTETTWLGLKEKSWRKKYFVNHHHGYNNKCGNSHGHALKCRNHFLNQPIQPNLLINRFI